MTSQRRISRRGFLRLAGACCATCAAAGAAGYAFESAALPPPLPASAALAPSPTLTAVQAATPLLLLTNSHAEGAFGPYLGEILRGEGLLTFTTTPVEQIDAATLARHSAVLLGPGPLSLGAVEILRTFVADGGGLVAIRPHPRLDSLLGVHHLGDQNTGGQLQVVARHPMAQGIDQGRLQIHSTADHLELVGAEALALDTAGHPLVTVRRLGRGLAIAWAFDLGQNIALLRQGNPAYTGQERDGLEGVRAADLFQGWIDLERIAVPQADELARLLANNLAAASPAPLPRLWYFPAPAAALLVLTGDAHGSRMPALHQALGLAERHGATMSVYYAPPPASTARRLLRRARGWLEGAPLIGATFDSDSGLPSGHSVATIRERGHEFGMHPYVEQGLETGYSAYWNDFIKLGYGPLPATVRTHRILWDGWVGTPSVQARYGIGMNLDHYHDGPVTRRPDGSWADGFLTGSGLPLRFVDEGGRLLNVYQQQTHLVDEQLMDVWADGTSANLSGDEAAGRSIALLNYCLDHFPAALGVQCHLDNFSFGGERAANAERWLGLTLERAAAAGVPIRSAERWLEFTHRRAEARAEEFSWDETGGRLRLRLNIPPGSDDLLLMLPAIHGGRELRMARVDSSEAGLLQQQLGGVAYRALRVPAGAREVEGFWG